MYRPHEDRFEALPDGLEQPCHQPHVVVEREPTQDALTVRITNRQLKRGLIRGEIAVSDADSLGFAGRARGVLEKRDIIRIGAVPAHDRRWYRTGVDHEQSWKGLPHRLGIAGPIHENRASSSIVKDAGESLLYPAAACRPERHGDPSRYQTTKE